MSIIFDLTAMALGAIIGASLVKLIPAIKDWWKQERDYQLLSKESETKK